MKKRAKILVWIGIIWILLILAFSTILYFKAKAALQFSGGRVLTEEEASTYLSMVGGWKSLIETVDARSPFTSIFVNFLEFGIPAWILFVIAGIFGRENKFLRVKRR